MRLDRKNAKVHPISHHFIGSTMLHSVQLPANFSSHNDYIEHLLAFIHEFSFLYDHHAVNFFVSDYYNTFFPNEWRFLKNQCSFNDLLELAAHGNIKVQL